MTKELDPKSVMISAVFFVAVYVFIRLDNAFNTLITMRFDRRTIVQGHPLELTSQVNGIRNPTFMTNSRVQMLLLNNNLNRDLMAGE